MDRIRPGDEPCFGAIVPLAQRIYRRHATTSTLHGPQDYSSYEGVLEPAGPGVWFDPEIGNDPRWQKRWKSTERDELRLTPSRIVLLRCGGARSSAAAR